MKQIKPSRYCGKFLCLDGNTHDWFMPVVKTLVHSCRVYFAEKKLSKDAQKNFVMQPSFPQHSIEPKVTWLGHSTFLIQIAGKNIITDPIFGSLSFIFRRLIPSVVQAKDLPKIDYVLISHNHFDHMDSKSLHQIKEHSPEAKFLVPMGDKEWFDKKSFNNVSEHMWWDQIIDEQIQDLKFSFLPANHWSQRTLFDKNKSLWGSWMIEAHGFKIYFAGDTSWGNHFAQIGDAFKDIDIACLPIAPGEPHEWMKETHINAREAVKAFIKLKAKQFIPMHWGTFHLGFDDFYAPLKLLKKSWQEFRSELKNKDLKIMKFGELVKGTPQRLIHAVKASQKSISV